MLLLWPNKCFFFLQWPTKPNIIAHKKCLNFIKAEKKEIFFCEENCYDNSLWWRRLFVYSFSLTPSFSQFLWNLIKFFVLNVLSERGSIYTVIQEHIQYTQQTPWVLYIKKCEKYVRRKKRVYVCKQIIWKWNYVKGFLNFNNFGVCFRKYWYIVWGIAYL